MTTSSLTEKGVVHAGTGAGPARFAQVRELTMRLCEPLSPEDSVVQSMTDASPAKWHLAHTTWFFETFILKEAVSGYRPFRTEYQVLFNSYYNTIGEQHPRPRRGMLTRPGLEEVHAYRRHVDREVSRLLDESSLSPRLLEVLRLGLNHEQQHQELILTDIKHMLSCNPTWPVYRELTPPAADSIAPMRWMPREGGAYRIGYEGDGFSFDNERPRHGVLLEAFEIASRTITNGEYLEFIEDGGYAKPELWLSDGWDTVRNEGWEAPLYWRRRDGMWEQFTLSGPREVRREEPVCHVSYYEADAFARWAGARLPTEAEWETVAAEARPGGNTVESGLLHPAPVSEEGPGSVPADLLGNVWEWTLSPYTPYPGYEAPAGALGEYNGKFMCNQMVLRGGSCATPESHIRHTYRNFFYPQARWQFSGVRLARGVK